MHRFGRQVIERFQSDASFHNPRITAASDLAYYEFWNGPKG
jgi:hypothetical protein